MNLIPNKSESTLFAACAAVVSLACIFVTAGAFGVPPAKVTMRDPNLNTPTGVVAFNERNDTAPLSTSVL